MKVMWVFVAIALAVTVAACGGGSTSLNPANGAWSETLAAATGQTLGTFTFTLTQNNTTLAGSHINFTNLDSLAQCFGPNTVFNGQMGQGMMNGGTMTMAMCWTASNGGGTNCMDMHGNMGMGMRSGSGMFTLTGHTPGCTSEQGTFAMTHM